MSVCKNYALIPYFLDVDANHEIRMLFIRENSEQKWGISVGTATPNEDQEGRLHEAADNLGIFLPFTANIKSLGNQGKFILSVGAVVRLEEVSLPLDDQEVAWLTVEEFEKTGRDSQKHIVRTAFREISKTIVVNSD